MTELAECYRGGVLIQECDAFGHLNIAYYVERFADSAHELMRRLAPGTRWQTRAIATRYIAELRAGDPIAIASGIIRLDAATLTVGHIATNGMGGPMTTCAEQVLALDAPDGEAWAETRAKLEGATAPWRELPFDPVKLPEKPGPVPTGLARVKAWQADEDGRLSLFGIVDRFSTANLVNMNAAGMTSTYMRSEKRGFATFETRLALFPPAPAVGETVATTSGMLNVGNSSVTILHQMSLPHSGRRVARYYQAGVHFDLEARRSAPLPESLRNKAREYLITE
ncbi:MAG TPA: acyl-[acyl-carrier-protein] thioesterase [Stellaceae bacterium]|jgi:acyl-CoA thioester hydrolase|nr:acyl-[acyl-carrier-protein] thioesterase [Stellaceae bacterium]